MTENKTFNIKKSSVAVFLACAVALAPVCPANARPHHHDNTIVAAAVGGAVAGLVGAVVQSTLTPTRTVIVEEPAYIVEPEPVIVRETVVIREPRHHRPHPVRYARHYYRYY